MSVELPRPLRAALEQELEGVSRRGLAERAARTSAAYRAGQGSAGVIRDVEDALAYALARLPATYAACATVFAEAARMAPEFAPAEMLDAGSGPAAASWAALQAWPVLQQVTWLDASTPFLDSAGRLAVEAPPPLREARRLRADLTAPGPWPSADLVAASYALAEIPPAKQVAVVTALWAAARGLLVLVEPGTPAGFARLLQARTALVAAGADLLAPCPHARSCPLAAPDWCHFSVRLPRSRDHRLAKGAEAPFEDEKFAYLIAARPGVAAGPRSARVLRHPRASKPGLELRLCGEAGLETRLVGKRDKVAHARARRLGWGDAWET
ncbi:small ribosomal subunit Rsm22 family protein [Phenylobacterium sp.]|jgi:ribosomal protein RSM22 (predicted rRNA methylase)|uniref:small ribosomal subunit Rsm22 family protein n=1 Tax=Phenylobacterium sp. TaxID=1871053 RepID=UPI002F95E67E